jgi:hypothetical protein
MLDGEMKGYTAMSLGLGLTNGQNGKQGDVKDLNAASLQAQADAKASSS